MTFRVEIFPIGIGEYDNHPTLDVETEIARLAAILADFDAEISRPWQTAMTDRGRDAIDLRLSDWSKTGGGPTILYWVGHGWSNVQNAALLHARSTDSNGLPPTDLARQIATWEARGDPDLTWLLVVIDACQSADYAMQLAHAIDQLGGRHRIVIIGTAGRGSTILGRLTDSLDTVIRNTFAADFEISATRLSSELVRTIPEGVRRILDIDEDAVLRRTVPALEYTGPLDLRAMLTDVLATVTDDERRHFVSKAQGGELGVDRDSLGEVGWYFTGRERERRAVLRWLDEDSGLLVVTGRAGSGKSALLGDILVRSRPRLAQVLLDHGLLDRINAEPPQAFDCALNLTGLSADEVVMRISAALGVIAPDRDQPFTVQLDHLAQQVGNLTSPPRLVLDALDEAVDQLRVAAVLRRLGNTPGIRLLVGTRRSTREGPDRPHTSEADLLEALAARNALVIQPDPDAVGTYVTRRLTDADLPAIQASSIKRAARSIRDAGQEFLYARLAVHELLAQPELLTSPVPVTEILGPDHRSIFAAALRRLAQANASYQPLLRGLALALGRGAPILDGVWTNVAFAATGAQVNDEAVNALLADAAPYLALDTDHGQTVYRLAHRTFAEALTADRDATRRQHQQITRHGITILRQPEPNIYWRRYISGHAVGGGVPAWEELDRSSGVLEILDSDAVAADAMRDLFGYAAVPPQIAGVISAAHQLRTANQSDRGGIRQLAVAHHLGDVTGASPTDGATWSVRWASVQPRSLHATLTSYPGVVTALVAVPLSDGRTLLAIGGSDPSILLWDPVAGTLVGDPLTGHTRWVWQLAAVPLPDGRTLLASGSDDETVRLWDPATGTQVGDPLIGHSARVNVVAAVPMSDGRTLLATGGSDGSVRLWDPITGAPVGGPLTRAGRRLNAVVAVPLADGRTLLAISSDDQELVLLWDPITRTYVSGPLETAHGPGPALRDPVTGRQVAGPMSQTHSVTALAAVPLPDGCTLLATGSSDQAVRLWDPATGTPVGGPLTGHTFGVDALAVVPLSDGRTLLASGGGDCTVRLWDPSTAAPASGPMIGHTGSVRAIAAVQVPGGRTLLATGGQDETVRLWDPAAGTPVGDQLTAYRKGVWALVMVPLSDGGTLLAAGRADGSVWLYEPPTGTPVHKLTGHAGPVWALATVSLPGSRTLLASASYDGLVRLWDPTTGSEVGDPLTGHTNSVNAVAAVSLNDGQTLLATGSVDQTVRIWDPITGSPVGKPLLGHTDVVTALAPVPLPDGRILLASGSLDKTVRLWDPATGTPIGGPLTGQTSPVRAIAAVSLGDHANVLAIGSEDGSVGLCDPATGAAVGGPLTGHTGPVRAVATGMIGGRTTLVTGSNDNTVRLWVLATGTCTSRMPLGCQCRSIASLGPDHIAVGMDSGVAVIEIDGKRAVELPRS